MQPPLHLTLVGGSINGTSGSMACQCFTSKERTHAKNVVYGASELKIHRFPWAGGSTQWAVADVWETPRVIQPLIAFHFSSGSLATVQSSSNANRLVSERSLSALSPVVTICVNGFAAGSWQSCGLSRGLPRDAARRRNHALLLLLLGGNPRRRVRTSGHAYAQAADEGGDTWV